MSDRRGRIGAVRSDTIIVTDPSNGEIVWEVPDMGAAEAASRYPSAAQWMTDRRADAAAAESEGGLNFPLRC